MVREVSGVDFEVREGPRRAGDPPKLVADNAKIKSLFGWKPRFDDLRLIVETAWRWEQILKEKRSVLEGTAPLSRSA